MKIPLLAFNVLLTAATITSCTENSTNKVQTNNATDTLGSKPHIMVYEDSREHLQLIVPDTITLSSSFFFSSAVSKDLFLLKVNPGKVKNSKACFQIITSDGRLIYTQTFDAFYFVRGIYEPDTYRDTNGQAEYEAYMQQYWKSITLQQYEAYFKKSLDSFFAYIYPVDNIEALHAKIDDIEDKDFWEEIIQDTTIKLFDITCFDCDEGGSIIGFSAKQNKVVTLIEHD